MPFVFKTQCVTSLESLRAKILYVVTNHEYVLHALMRGHGGRVVTLSPPTSEAGVRSP